MARIFVCRYPPAYAAGTTQFQASLVGRKAPHTLRCDRGAILQPAHAGCPYAPHHGSFAKARDDNMSKMWQYSTTQKSA